MPEGSVSSQVGLVALTVVISKFTVLAMAIVVSEFEDSSVWTAGASA